MKNLHSRMLATLGMVAMVLGGMSLAWACTPHAQVSVNPDEGHAGAQITVRGTAFVPGPVQIRWNSESGELLGQASGPNFSISVRIPQAPAGVYSIVAVATDAHGNYAHGATFQVLATEGSTSPPSNEAPPSEESQTSGGGSGGGGSQGSGGSGNTSNSTNGGSGSQSGGGRGESSSSTSGGTTGPSGSGGGSAPQSGSPGSGFPSQGGSRGDSRPGGSVVPDAGPASSNPPILRTAAGQKVFGGSVGVAEFVSSPSTAARGSDSTTALSRTRSTEQPSEAAATSDLWASVDSLGPSLTPSITAAAPGVGVDGESRYAVGVGLLAAGLVALFGAFLAAEVRRQRVLAQAPSRR